MPSSRISQRCLRVNLKRLIWKFHKSIFWFVIMNESLMNKWSHLLKRSRLRFSQSWKILKLHFKISKKWNLSLNTRNVDWWMKLQVLRREKFNKACRSRIYKSNSQLKRIEMFQNHKIWKWASKNSNFRSAQGIKRLKILSKLTCRKMKIIWHLSRN